MNILRKRSGAPRSFAANETNLEEQTRPAEPCEPHQARGTLTLEAFRTTLIVIACGSAVLVLWLAAHYVLLLFAGILFALLLDAIARGLSKVADVPRFLRLFLSIAFIAGLAALLILLVPSALAQAPKLAHALDSALQWLRDTVARYAPLASASGDSQPQSLIRLVPEALGLLAQAANILAFSLSLVTGTVLILVFGLYLVFQPERYTQALLRLFSTAWRTRVDAALNDAGTVLRRWLVGKTLTMFLIGIGTYAGLSLLGVELALILSFIAGAAAFIPYIGPIVGGAAMVLVALTQSSSLALAVLGFYAGLQLIESYFLTPLIQSRAILLPPAVVIFTQVVFGVLFGPLGLALATPMAAVGGVVIKRLCFDEPLWANKE